MKQSINYQHNIASCMCSRSKLPSLIEFLTVNRRHTFSSNVITPAGGFAQCHPYPRAWLLPFFPSTMLRWDEVRECQCSLPLLSLRRTPIRRFRKASLRSRCRPVRRDCDSSVIVDPSPCSAPAPRFCAPLSEVLSAILVTFSSLKSILVRLPEQ